MKQKGELNYYLSTIGWLRLDLSQLERCLIDNGTALEKVRSELISIKKDLGKNQESIGQQDLFSPPAA